MRSTADSEAGRIFESETTANQSEIRRAYLVSVIGNFVPITKNAEKFPTGNPINHLTQRLE